MNFIQKLGTTTVMACLLLPAVAMAETFSFTQAGFSEGATVSMTFTGTDNDIDGQISSFNGEVTAFSMSFSGNTVVPAFSLSFPDLFGLVYDLDGGPLGDGQILGIEGVGASGPQFSYAAGPGPVGLCGVGVICAIVSDGVSDDTSMELLVRGSLFGPAVAIPTLSVWGLFGLFGLFVMFSFRAIKSQKFIG